jgi:hypothetical protein
LMYQTVLEQHVRLEHEFSENSYLFHSLCEAKFYKCDLAAFHHEREQRGWQRSPQGILAWLQARQRSLEQSHVIHGGVAKPKQQAYLTQVVHGAAPLLATARVGSSGGEEDGEVLEQDADELDVQSILVTDAASGRPYRRIPECDFKGIEPCMTNHLLKNCKKFIGMTKKGRVQHLIKVKRCHNCFSLEH